MRLTRTRFREALVVTWIVLGVSLVALPVQGGAADVSNTPGYWLSGADGGVFSFGSAEFYGSGVSSGACRVPIQLHSRVNPALGCDAIEATPNGDGYWLLNVHSWVTPFGDAGNPLQGSCTDASELPSESDWVGVVSSPTGRGFVLVSSGGVLTACGDARFEGDLFAIRLNAVPVGIAAMPDGKGYWIAAADGGVFAFGDAGFFGSMGGTKLNQPVVGIAATPDGRGYWLVAADGGVFSFGDARFHGSMGGKPLNAPMVGIAADPDGGGYWTAASDGGIFAFGTAPFGGSLAGRPLNGPIVGIAAASRGADFSASRTKGAGVDSSSSRPMG